MQKDNYPIFHRSHLLHQLMDGYKPLLVTGTHGKTTTAALLASVLLKAGLEPSYAIGGILRDLNVNAAHRAGRYFVAEADESDGSFLKYVPYGTIITNVDNDHILHYGSEAALYQAFKSFADKTLSSKHLFYCGDDRQLAGMNINGISYGFNRHNMLCGSNFRQQGWRIYFNAEYDQRSYQKITLNLPGYHNALNALAVFGICLSLGIDEGIIRSTFNQFKGVKRRVEHKGECQDILVLDDYGHHPSEIKTTLEGIKLALPERRLIVIFQPHRYTRTRDCLVQFGCCFDAADEVMITDIYASSEAPIPGIDPERIVEEVRKQSKVSVKYVPQESLCQEVLKIATAFDVIVTQGAGNITTIGSKLIERLSKS